MSELVVRSNHRGDQLRLWTIKLGDEWRAQIDFGDLTAEAKVYERLSRDALRLDGYLADLASNWRGWDGDKDWEARRPRSRDFRCHARAGLRIAGAGCGRT